MSGGPAVDLTIEVRFANGRIMAASRADRRMHEWPMHWGRLFSAIVNALHGPGMSEDAEADAAVRWIEGLPPPVVLAPEAKTLTTLPVYVPSNDESVNDKAGAALPEAAWRRNARVFPGVAARTPLLRYTWKVAPGDLERHGPALEGLLARIVYFGRSVNFVGVGLAAGAPEDLPHADLLLRYEPDPSGDIEMRTARPGRLDTLRAQYEAGLRADPGPTARYRRPGDAAGEASVAHGPWSPHWLVFGRVGGVRAAITDTEGFAKAVRRELVRRARVLALMRGEVDGPLPEIPVRPFISGHAPDGTPHKGDRLGIVPLADVLHGHADGLVLGFALLVPGGTPIEDWTLLSTLVRGSDAPGASLPPLEEIPLPGGGMKVSQSLRKTPMGLTPARYVGPARTWATVTPILLGRHPKTRDAGEVERLVVAACAQSGLPEPEQVAVRQHAFFEALPAARRFAQALSQTGAQDQKHATHAAVRFSQGVKGPVLVGSGRYHGLGLMAPIEGDLDPFSVLSGVADGA